MSTVIKVILWKGFFFWLINLIENHKRYIRGLSDHNNKICLYDFLQKSLLTCFGITSIGMSPVI